MSFPNESEENISQAGQNWDVPSFASSQELPPENEPWPVEPPSRHVPKKRPYPAIVLVILLGLAGCLIFFGLHTLSLSNGAAMARAEDMQATQVARAQETSTVSAGNATALALETVVPRMSPQAIYQTYTQGKPLFSDPLTDFNNTYFYDPDTMKPEFGCVFQKDGLHITSANADEWIPCNNSAFPDLMNFSFQYDFSILKGGSAGLRFRALGLKSYYFDIDTSGNYEFLYYTDVTNGQTAQTIQSGVSKLIQKGYGVKNQLTLIAIGSLFYFYLNQKFLMKATDPTLTIGGLSLLASS